jgi:hypothetical protein
LRAGALPVIATSFTIEDLALLAQLENSTEPILFKKLSSELAQSLQCVVETRFVDWIPEQAIGNGRRDGTLHVSMVARKNADGKYRIELGEIILVLNNGVRTPLKKLPPQLRILYGANEPKEPGPKGENWRNRLADRFHTLAENQDFRNDLASTLQGSGGVVLTTTDDHRLADDAKRIGLDLLAKDLEATEGTQLILYFPSRNGLIDDVKLKTDSCRVRREWWWERVQCMVVDGESERAGTAWNRLHNWDQGDTEVQVERYAHGNPKICPRLGLERP